MNNAELYKISKNVYREAVIHSQLQAAGSNQAKFLERVEKDRMARMQDQVLKVLSAFYIAMLFLLPLRSFTTTSSALNGGISSEWVTFVGSCTMGGFFLIMPLILLIFSITFMWGLMSGGPYKWIHTLPFSKKDIEKIGLFTFLRSMNFQLVVMLLVLPAGTIAAIAFTLSSEISLVNSILMVFFSIAISLVSIVFYLSIVVILGRKMAILMEEHEVSSKRTTFIRIMTFLLYLICSMVAMYVIQLGIEIIPQLYLDPAMSSETVNTLNIIFSFIPYPFSGSYFLTSFIIGFSNIPSLILVGSITGLVLFCLLTILLYRKALNTLRNITSTDFKKYKEKYAEVIIDQVTINKSKPLRAFFKRDITLITREMQYIMYLVMPIMIPIVGAIAPFDYEPIGNSALTPGFLFLLFYVVLNTYMLIVGLTNIEAGGETITASLPIVVRDQVKGKLLFFFTTIPLAYLSFFLFSIGDPHFWDMFRFGLLYLPVIPILGIAGIFFKVLTFGKMKHKFVLEEINNRFKISKYILGFIFVAALAIFYAFMGYLGDIAIIVSEVVSIILLLGAFHFMFPKPKSQLAK